MTGGEEATEFVMHKELLSQNSSYFKNAFQSGMKENETLHFGLLDVDSFLVKNLSSWFYFPRLSDDLNPSIYVVDESSRDGQILLDLVKVWVFGDRMGVIELQNEVIDVVHRSSGRGLANNHQLCS